MSPKSIPAFLRFVLCPARGALLPTAMLFAACGGGGGGGSQPPDLQVGVDLTGPWLLSTTLVSITGTFCNPELTVGQVDVDGVTLTHERATRRLAMDDGTPIEMVSTMSGTQVRLARVRAHAGVNQETELVLTFSPDGEACTGTARFHAASVDGSCTVLGNVHGARPAELLHQEPAPASVQACPDSVISATFSLPLEPSTVDRTTFLVHGPAGAVAGTVDALGPTATFFPSAPLAEGTVYTAFLTTAVRFSNGAPLPLVEFWSFTTLDYEGEVLASEPVAYWRLDETSGTLAQSRVGGGPANGTFAGTFARNQPGPWVGATAASFDNGFMESSRSFAVLTFDGRTVLAVEFWLRPEEDRVAPVYCLGPGIYFGGSTTTPEFIVNLNRFVGTVATPLGQWTHIVLQITGSHAEVWRNGELARQLPFSGALNGFPANLDFRIGNASRSTMDEVAIYHHALTAAEIQSHYAAGTHCQ